MIVGDAPDPAPLRGAGHRRNRQSSRNAQAQNANGGDRRLGGRYVTARQKRPRRQRQTASVYVLNARASPRISNSAGYISGSHKLSIESSLSGDSRIKRALVRRAIE